jgi:5-methylcytosine-specific restriction protein A
MKPPTFRRPGAPRNEAERKAMYDHRRPSRVERGYDRDWLRVRAAFALAHPVCSEPGCDAPVEEVDHIEPIRNRPDLRLAWSNLRSFCRSHHSRRTAREQGFARSGPRDG